MTGAAPPSRYRGIAYVFGQGGALALGAAIGRAVERGAFAPRERMHRHGALHNEQQETDAGGTGGGSAGGGSGGGGRTRSLDRAEIIKDGSEIIVISDPSFVRR